MTGSLDETVAELTLDNATRALQMEMLRDNIIVRRLSKRVMSREWNWADPRY